MLGYIVSGRWNAQGRLKTMRKTQTLFCTLVAAIGLITMTAGAQGITSVALGSSTSPNGIIFTGGSGTGNLAVDIGGCPFLSTSCTAPGSVTGSLTVSSFTGNYSLSADSLTASFGSTASNGVDTWSLSGPADTFSLGVLGFSGGVGGTISWLDIVENTSGVSLIGNVSYSGSGAIWLDRLGNHRHQRPACAALVQFIRIGRMHAGEYFRRTWRSAGGVQFGGLGLFWKSDNRRGRRYAGTGHAASARHWTARFRAVHSPQVRAAVGRFSANAAVVVAVAAGPARRKFGFAIDGN